MILYVNGDSHSAGAELIKDYSFAQDDPKYKHLGRRAHPDAVPLTYGYKLSKTLNTGFYLDAESGSSNDRILRTTREFLRDNRNQQYIIIIGWSSWEREEWEHKDDFIQVNASGQDSVPEELQDKYKDFVASSTRDKLEEKQLEWHQKIHDFHIELYDKNIKHLFFNSYSWFKKLWRPRIQPKFEWHGCYYDPYEQSGTYSETLNNQNILPVRHNSYHYGVDGHVLWHDILLEQLTKQIGNVTMNTVKRNIKPSVRK